jgi:hypothetical protein
MDEETILFNCANVLEVNERNRSNPKCINLKGRIYLGCIKCEEYHWFNKEDINNPICIFCKLHS